VVAFSINGFGGVDLEYARNRKSYVNIGLRWSKKNKGIVQSLIERRELRMALIIVVQGKHGWDDYETIYNSFDLNAK
jgi:hypothetical protein